MKIRKYNIPAHIDIEEVIKRRVVGQATFTVRVNAGNIVDLTQIEYVDTGKKYGDIKQATGEQFTLSHSTGERNTGDAVWNDNNNSIFGKQEDIDSKPSKE